jgi:hypothetical protein
MASRSSGSAPPKGDGPRQTNAPEPNNAPAFGPHPLHPADANRRGSVRDSHRVESSSYFSTAPLPNVAAPSRASFAADAANGAHASARPGPRRPDPAPADAHSQSIPGADLVSMACAQPVLTSKPPGSGSGGALASRLSPSQRRPSPHGGGGGSGGGRSGSYDPDATSTSAVTGAGIAPGPGAAPAATGRRHSQSHRRAPPRVPSRAFGIAYVTDDVDGNGPNGPNGDGTGTTAASEGYGAEPGAGVSPHPSLRRSPRHSPHRSIAHEPAVGTAAADSFPSDAADNNGDDDGGDPDVSYFASQHSSAVRAASTSFLIYVQSASAAAGAGAGPSSAAGSGSVQAYVVTPGMSVRELVAAVAQREGCDARAVRLASREHVILSNYPESLLRDMRVMPLCTLTLTVVVGDWDAEFGNAVARARREARGPFLLSATNSHDVHGFFCSPHLMMLRFIPLHRVCAHGCPRQPPHV